MNFCRNIQNVWETNTFVSNVLPFRISNHTVAFTDEEGDSYCFIHFHTLVMWEPIRKYFSRGMLLVRGSVQINACPHQSRIEPGYEEQIDDQDRFIPSSTIFQASLCEHCSTAQNWTFDILTFFGFQERHYLLFRLSNSNFMIKRNGSDSLCTNKNY